MKKFLTPYVLFLLVAWGLGSVVFVWPWAWLVSFAGVGALLWMVCRETKKVLGKSVSLENSRKVQVIPPGSAGRPIGDVKSFLEDIKARGFEPRGILDIGANRGDWTQMALGVFPGARSVMVEPQTEMEPFLRKLCKKDPRCRYFMCGAGAQEGELVLTLWEDTYGSSFTLPKDENLLRQGKQRSTPIRTVDSILHEVGPAFFPDLVKVDVQGFELEVLKGGKYLIEFAEVAILETTLLTGDNAAWPSAWETIEFMKAKGYVIYDITSFLRRPLDGALWQTDFAFVKASGRFRQSLNR